MRIFSPIFLLLSGCVSIKTHEGGVHSAYIRGLEDARGIAANQLCSDAVYLISGKMDTEEVSHE